MGFGLLILVVCVVFYITNKTLNESREINKRINNVYAPSVKALDELNNQLVRTQQLMKRWSMVQIREDDRDRTEVVTMCEQKIPSQLKLIKTLSSNWEPSDTLRLHSLVLHYQNLNIAYSEIRKLLSSFESYLDPMSSMMAEDYFVEGGLINSESAAINEYLNAILTNQRNSMNVEIELMNKSFEKLRMLLVNISISVFIVGLLIAYFTTRSIVKPVNSLKRKLTNLSQGIYTMNHTRAGNDEIGDMALAVHRLITNFEKTKEFSLSVGAGHFNVPFTPLSEQDELGHALIQMRNDLASYRHEMEDKVAKQTEEIRKQKEQVELQRERIVEVYNDLQSSIDYAKRLQETILPNDKFVRDMFPKSFVLNRPKATVSGDFYWFKTKGNKKMVAAADCTGHGVPGAFMSLVGHNILNQASKVYNQPASILNTVNRLSAEVMRSNEGQYFMRDGMDISLCIIDDEAMTLEYSGAHNSVYIIRDGEVFELEAEHFSIGTFVNGEKEFLDKTFQLKKDDCIYLYSDGYADQFGGPKGKKYLRKRFKNTLKEISKFDMNIQLERLNIELDIWQGGHQQVDDVLVIGIKM
jgi:serine phosphatase RsbU (regulator of sigma subunit)/HAMP domain-containing protein